MTINQLKKITKNLRKYPDNFSTENTNESKNILIQIKKEIIKHKKKIINSINQDVKKSISDCEEEFGNSIDVWNYAINNVNKIKTKKRYIYSNNKSGLINYVPVGLVGFITPWNYPLLTLSERLPFCLGSGCSAIIKPSEHTPNFAKVLRKIINTNQKLSNRINITHNLSAEMGTKLCRDPNISLISFVGSSLTGKKILKQCASTLKKTNLELGGKNAAVVFKSSKIDTAVTKIIKGIFENGGQACVAISRILVEDSIYDKFIKKIIFQTESFIKSKKIKIQIPANNKQKKKTHHYLKYIKKYIKKNYLKIFNSNVNKSFSPIFIFKNISLFKNQEFFFPIVTFEKFTDINDCIKKNNSTGYGLASYVFTNNKEEISKLLRFTQCGRIWINSTLKWSPTLPVGGYKMTGGGRDMGKDGFQFYLTTKSVYIENDN